MLEIEITNVSTHNLNQTGEWFSFPVDEELLVKKLNTAEHGDDHYVITDQVTNLPLKVSNETDILELNWLARVVASLDDVQFKKLCAIMEEHHSTIKEALEDSTKYELIEEVRSLKDVGRYYLENSDMISDYWKGFMDYERYGKYALSYDDFLSDYGLMLKCG
jgi:hypothetical protein